MSRRFVLNCLIIRVLTFSIIGKMHKKENMRPERVMRLDYNQEDLLQLNLSNDNPDLKKVEDQDQLAAYIQEKLRSENKKYAIGGYGENRSVYQQFKHFDTEESGRSIHLGIDFWAAAGSVIQAPFYSKVHSWAFNDNPGDYGGTLILEHPQEDLFSLYGHLGLKELEGLNKGTEFKAGEPIARVGLFNENGGWPPHLHFQLIKDLGSWVGDYPGVVAPDEAELYLQNCPNPVAFF